MAINEALCNAIYHGNLEVESGLRVGDESAFFSKVDERRGCAVFGSRRVQIDADLSQDEIRICITDQGPGFDPQSVCDPTQPENLEQLCGRGLLLIKSFMDEVVHSEQGKRITLIKRRCT